VFQPLFIRKLSQRSGLLVHYYYWILPYAAGVLLFSLFEAYAWFARKSVLSNFLKETGLRLLQSLLIVLFLVGLLTFDGFVKLFSFTFLVIGIILTIYLARKGEIPVNFRISRVSFKFRKKIGGFVLLLYGSLIINTVVQYIDSIIIASVSVKGLTDVGIYTLATFVTNTIQVPQRSIIAATVPVLSSSWKNKNLGEINRIYHRTSINLLLISLFIFIMIWLNIDDLFSVLHINKEYESGKWVILLLGFTRIIDAGTGVNNYIIGTSNFWKFEVFTGIILLCLSIPLNYTLVKSMGITGSAISNLVAYTIYNIIRVSFLYWKFSMQPFTLKTLYALLTAVALYAICYFSMGAIHSWIGIIARGIVFGGLFIGAIFLFRLTPDAHQLWEIAKGYFKKDKK
jgi:O-antigen/teichoic acid export membrane protein